MVQLQCLSRILNTQDISILINNNLTDDYFPEYVEELSFIKEHNEKYHNVPDIASFLEKFPDFELVDVQESERYLVDTIREEHLYAKSVPVLKKMAELLKSDANAAAQYMQSVLPNLQPNYTTPSVDIIHDDSRVKEFEERGQDNGKFTIETGFQEIDESVGQWECGEELVVFFARTNQCKSWVVTKCMQHAWRIGKNVAYVSPEMSANKLAYRFDTLNQNLSNLALMRGDINTITVEDYNNYVEELKTHSNTFLVTTPADFDREITISKLRNFILANKLDMLAIDGITYMTDERYKRGDNKTTTLTNISEDLMDLSIELNIPILIVVQSNRGGVKEDGNATPELEDIRDSDGIAHNASKVFSIRKKEENIIICNKKNRYGRVGDSFTYHWNIDLGELEWIPTLDDPAPIERKEARKRQIKESIEPNSNRKIVF